jgi:CspA family cold shock protein
MSPTGDAIGWIHGVSLREGDKVSFEVGQDRKIGKSEAENVSVL